VAELFEIFDQNRSLLIQEILLENGLPLGMMPPSTTVSRLLKQGLPLSLTATGVVTRTCFSKSTGKIVEPRSQLRVRRNWEWRQKDEARSFKVTKTSTNLLWAFFNYVTIVA
jgi:hypothetical protein